MSSEETRMQLNAAKLYSLSDRSSDSGCLLYGFEADVACGRIRILSPCHATARVDGRLPNEIRKTRCASVSCARLFPPCFQRRRLRRALVNGYAITDKRENRAILATPAATVSRNCRRDNRVFLAQNSRKVASA